MTKFDLLKSYVRALVESRLREADVTDGKKVAFGSIEHLQDLTKRINDLEQWRDRQRRGTESRANYSRIIAKLKTEFRSAQKYSETKAQEIMGKIKEKITENVD